jgi:site-specific recombinase XerD
MRSAQCAACSQGCGEAREAAFDGRVHTLWHSAASVTLSAGVPLQVVSEIFGHASIAITGDVNGHVSPDVSREANDPA